MRAWLRNHRGFLALILLLGVFRSAIADWNHVPSGSMRPTILQGDVLLVNRLAYDLKLPLSDVVLARLHEPRRGDIVTFRSPKTGERLVKRVVGLPGDTVAMRDKVVIINGRPAHYVEKTVVEETFSDGSTLPAQRLAEDADDGRAHLVQWVRGSRGASNDNFGPLSIPADEYLMLGDNRDDSADFRYFGLVPRQRIIGRVMAVLVSADILGNWSPRFDRFGESLN